MQIDDYRRSEDRGISRKSMRLTIDYPIQMCHITCAGDVCSKKSALRSKTAPSLLPEARGIFFRREKCQTL